MINTNEYIIALFGFIGVLMSIYVAIYLSKIERSKKRKITIIVTATAILLLIILTIIYGYGKFNFSKLLPFGKQQFTDNLFIEKYKVYFACFSGAVYSYYMSLFSRCGNDIGWAADHSVILDKRYVIITILFHFPISIYAHIWYIYILCYYSFSPIICILISIVLITIEFCILYFINKHLTFRKLRKMRSGSY